MRSDDDKKNYWRKYSKFGEHEHVKKNLTLNQNNQKEIIAIKTFLIDQPFSGNDYKLHRTSCLSSNTKISNVTMMGNRVKGAGNGKRETGNRKQGASQGERQNEKWEQKQRIENENTDRATVPTSFAGFSPTRPYGLSTGGRENMRTRLLGFKLGFVSVFHFPVPRFISMSKKSYFDNLFYQEAGDWK